MAELSAFEGWTKTRGGRLAVFKREQPVHADIAMEMILGAALAKTHVVHTKGFVEKNSGYSPFFNSHSRGVLMDATNNPDQVCDLRHLGH